MRSASLLMASLRDCGRRWLEEQACADLVPLSHSRPLRIKPGWFAGSLQGHIFTGLRWG
jgi:hypothetical protein